MDTPTKLNQGSPDDAVSHADRDVEVGLTLDEARLLRAVAQLGLRAAGGEGSANGNTPQAQAAIAKLAAVIDDAETVVKIRAALEEAGFETRRLSDAQVFSLHRRLADIR